MTCADWRAEITALEASGDASATLARLERLGFEHPEDPELNFELAERYRLAGRFGEAVLVYALVAEIGSTDFSARALLAQANCLGEIGEFDRAKTAIEAARSQDPGSHLPVVAHHVLEVRRGNRPDWEAEARAAFNVLRPDCRAELLRHIGLSIVQRHFANTRAAPSWGGKEAGPVPALARAGLLMMIKDEADIILQNLEHHHRVGFRNFCILDNGSTDSSVALVRRFEAEHPDVMLLLVHDPVIGFYQSEKMDIFQQTFVRYAELAGRTLEWLFLVDADEFVAYFEGDPGHGVAELDRVLSDPQHDLLVMHWVHAGPSRLFSALPAEYDPFTLFDRTSSDLQTVVPKVAFRTGRGFRPKMGNHFVEDFDRPYDAAVNAALIGWYMLHAQLRSISQTRTKIINGGRAYRDAPGLENHGGHWRDRHERYERHGEAIVEQVLGNYLVSIR